MKPILSYPSWSAQTSLLLSNNEGIHNPKISQIMYCKSDDTYTAVHLTNGQVIVVSTNLKYYEDLLKNFGFFRSHQTHLINTTYLSSITNTETGWTIVMSNNEILPLAKKKKIELVEQLQLSSVNRLYAHNEKRIEISVEESSFERKAKLHVVRPIIAEETEDKIAAGN